MPSDSIEDHVNSSHDFYALLSLSSNSTDSQIRRAYRKTALKYHPDKQKPGTTAADDAAALEKFHLLRIAHDLLIDPVLRTKYDANRSAQKLRQEAEERLEGRRRKMKEDLERRETGVKRARDDADERERRIKMLAEDGKRRRKELEETLKRQRDELRTEQAQASSPKDVNGCSKGTTPSRNGPKDGYKVERERLSHLFNTPVGRSQAAYSSTFGGSAPPKFSFAPTSSTSSSPSLEKLTLERLKKAERKKMEEKIRRDEEKADKEKVGERAHT